MISSALAGVQDSQGLSGGVGGIDPASLGKDEFLKLFVTQLEVQDPLNPLDSTEFTAQLAQFSSLEQLSNSSASLEALVNAQNTQSNLLAVGMIGRDVVARGSDFSLGTGGADLSYSFAQNVNGAVITIKSDAGTVVRTVELGSLTAGEGAYHWDGTDASGAMLPPGDFTFEINGVDDFGSTVHGETRITGTVTGLRFEGGQTVLDVGGRSVAVANVIRVEIGG